jgi:CheY-like chemotaxis protein
MSDQQARPLETVIVAEDSQVNRKILVHLLVKMGYNVCEYENGKLAWEAFSRQDPKDPIAIFSDIMMPEMDGISFLRNVRNDGPNKTIPFVLLTAVSDKDSIVEAKSLNVNGYLLKPVSYDKVKKKLSELFPTKKFPAMAG